MGEEIGKDHFHKQDFSAFEARLREETELLEGLFKQHAFVDRGYVAGFELEAWLVDPHYDPAPVNDRFIAHIGSSLVVPELARFNFEVNGPQQRLAGGALGVLHRDLLATWRVCERKAREIDAQALMIGILPTLRPTDLVLDNMSRQTRYRALNEQIMRLRKGQPLPIIIHGRDDLVMEHRDVMFESAATSFQIHLQVPADAAARIYNAALIVSAPLVALSANSPYLFGRDLWDETRIAVFEQSITVWPSRVTFGTGYARESLMDCFRENLDIHPVLLPTELKDPPEQLHHVRLHNGTVWRWNRPLIGFDADGRPHLRIEHRVVPAGPSLTDSIANAAMFYGLVYALGNSEPAPESRLPFDQARANFYDAAKLGLRARATWLDGKTAPIHDLLSEQLLPLAQDGLAQLGVNAADSARYLGVIKERLKSWCHGAAWQRGYVERHTASMHALTAAYHERQQQDVPVHEWEI